MRTIIAIIVATLTCAGCSPGAYVIRSKENEIRLEPEPTKLLGVIPVGGNIPAGKYEGKIGDKQIKVNTKLDMTLLDINANALKGD